MNTGLFSRAAGVALLSLVTLLPVLQAATDSALVTAAKDGDLNTAYSQTVEPLPFHGMSSYPYPEEEHYPEDPRHQEYRKKFNTRQLSGRR